MQEDRNARAGDQGAVTQGAKARLHLDWHALEKDEVELTLGASPDGLSSGEAARRLEIHGLNLLEEAKGASALSVLLHQFKSPLIYILLVAGLVTLALGEEIDAAVISAVLVFNAAIGFLQERRAERSVRALMQLAAPRARVVREGREREVASRELVPGDIVLLESGSCSSRAPAFPPTSA
jgi:Ca2+-transporting ATPase